MSDHQGHGPDPIHDPTVCHACCLLVNRALVEQLAQATQDLEAGFMPSTYARLKELQAKERELDEARLTGGLPEQPSRRSFLEDLTQLLNRHSQENGSNTPDFILARYLVRCLVAFEAAVQHRDRWYGEPAPAPGMKELQS